MATTVSAQIAQDPYLARLDALLAREQQARRSHRGRRGDGADLLELLQSRARRVREIRDAWAHGTGTLTLQEGQDLAAELTRHAGGQGRSANAMVLTDEVGGRIVFLGASKPHWLFLDHSTPDRIWAHWRGFIFAARPVAPICPSCEATSTSDCGDERRCSRCGETWTIEGERSTRLTDRDRIRHHKREGRMCFGPEEIERCPRHPDMTRSFRWVWQQPGPQGTHLDSLQGGGSVEVTRCCAECELDEDRVLAPKGRRRPAARAFGVPLGRPRVRMTFDRAKRELAQLGVVLVRGRGEYRVRLASQAPGEGYSTNDLADAIATGRDLARRR